MLLPFFVSIALLLLFDSVRWGEWSGSHYGELGFNTPLMDSMPRFVLSPELSLFLYNPLILASFYFLFRYWNAFKWFGIGLLAMDLIYLFVVAMYKDYHGGLCPGPRYFLSLVPLNLIPLFLGLSQERNRTFWVWGMLGVLVMVGISINGYEATVDYTTAPPAWDYWKGMLISAFRITL